MIQTCIALAALFLSFSCNHEPKGQNKNDRYFLISHAGAGDPFWNIEFNGAKKAASDLGIDLQIVAPETPNDIARQVELLNAAIASKPKGIALSIPDDHAFSRSLLLAQKQGLPIIAFNTKPNDDVRSKNPYLAFVGMDDTEAGRKLAQKAMAQGLITDRAVAAIHQAGHVAMERRFSGIRDELLKSSIHLDKLDISSDATQALQILRGYLGKNKNTSTLFLLGPFGLHAVGRIIKEEFPHVSLSSFDLTPLTVELLKNNSLAYSVDQQPFMQGYMAVMQLALCANYNLVPSDIQIQGAIVDKNNVETLQELVKKGVR